MIIDADRHRQCIRPNSLRNLLHPHGARRQMFPIFAAPSLIFPSSEHLEPLHRSPKAPKAPGASAPLPPCVWRHRCGTSGARRGAHRADLAVPRKTGRLEDGHAGAPKSERTPELASSASDLILILPLLTYRVQLGCSLSPTASHPCTAF